jgi:hypothetical protein
MLRNSISARIKYFFMFCITALVLVPLVMPDSSFALQVISGNQISIQEPIQDDVVIFGETVYIDAPQTEERQYLRILFILMHQ